MLLIIGWMVLPGCKAAKKLDSFALQYNYEIVIPSTVGVNLPFNVSTTPLPTNSFAEFERNNTNASFVEQIVLRRLRLKLISPTASNLAFLRSVRVYLAADGLPETLMAWREDIPDNTGNELELQPTNANMMAYLIKEKITFRVNIVPDRLIASEHRLGVETMFLVEARVLGK